MVISIWWLIGALQLTLAAGAAGVFFAFTSRIAKRQNKELKALLAKALHDYSVFADSFEPTDIDSIQSHQSGKIEESVEGVHATQTYENCFALYTNGINDLPEWDPSLKHSEYEHNQLKTAIEIHLAQLLMQDEPAAAQTHWSQFAQALQTDLATQAKNTEQQTAVIQDLIQQWLAKKPELLTLFNDLVTLGQQTTLASKIHEGLNIMYNNFIEIMNSIPELNEPLEDAHLKMESSSIASVKLKEPELDTLAVATDETDSLLPERIMQLSEAALDSDDEDLLELPANTIDDFDATQTPTRATLKPASDLDVADNIFDDLLNDMNEILDEDNPSKQNDA